QSLSFNVPAGTNMGYLSTANGGSGAAGNIAVTSAGALTTGGIYASSVGSKGGKVTVNAVGAISTGEIKTFSNKEKGEKIILKSGTSRFSLYNLYTYSGFGGSGVASPGTITFYASGNPGAPGAPIATPTVSFAAGAVIDVTGSSNSA